ncbi:MAG: acyltransferase [Christensenella sp.]
MKRNNAIEFWRFVFTMCVVMAHAWLCTGLNQGKYIFCSGGYSVEFFFILSGFFLAKTCKKAAGTDEPIVLSLKYTLKRFTQIAPMYYLTFCAALLTRLKWFKIIGQTSSEMLQYIKSVWREFFMLNGVLNYDNQANIPSWYLSVLLIIGFFVYLLVAIMLKQKFPTVLPLFVSAIILFIYYYSGTCNWSLFAYDVRGLAALLFGAGTYFTYEKLKDIKFNSTQKCILSIVELVCIAAMLYFVPFRPIDKYTPLVVIPFALLILISMLNTTLISTILNNRLSYWLGRICMGVYLGHMTLLIEFGMKAPFDFAAHHRKAYLLIGISSIAYGILLTIVVDGGKWLLAKISAKMKAKKAIKV